MACYLGRGDIEYWQDLHEFKNGRNGRKSIDKKPCATKKSRKLTFWMLSTGWRWLCSSITTQTGELLLYTNMHDITSYIIVNFHRFWVRTHKAPLCANDFEGVRRFYWEGLFIPIFTRILEVTCSYYGDEMALFDLLVPLIIGNLKISSCGWTRYRRMRFKSPYDTTTL